IDAAQAGLFVAAEEQRGTAMRAVVLKQPDVAVRVAKADQLLAEQQDAQGVRVRGRHLRRQHCRYPVLAHEVAHRRAWPDSGDQLVLFLLQHRSASPSFQPAEPTPWRLPWSP